VEDRRKVFVGLRTNTMHSHKFAVSGYEVEGVLSPLESGGGYNRVAASVWMGDRNILSSKGFMAERAKLPKKSRHGQISGNVSPGKTAPSPLQVL
jgi:hypothetical protein